MTENLPASAMPTEVADLSTSEILNRLAGFKQAGAPNMTPRRRGRAYIGFDGNTGALTYGRDKAALPLDQMFVAPLVLVYHGCTRWENSRPDDDRRMRVNMIENPTSPQPPAGEPMQGDLPKPRERDGWAFEVGLVLTAVDGEFNGAEFEFGHSSLGVKNAVLDLWAQMVGQAGTPEAAQGFVNPLVTFKVTSYHHKKFNREVFTPEFVIHEWANDKGERIKAGAQAASGNAEAEPDPFA